MRPRTVLALALVISGTALADPPPGTALLASTAGRLGYKVVHTLHTVNASCGAVEARVAALPTGSARVQVRARVACFDSGNSNRDGTMRAVTHEALFPWVSLKGTLDGIKLPLAAPLETQFTAMLEFNGQKGQVTLPLKLAPDGAGVKATFSFPISLDAFKVERPELMLVKIDDKVVIDGEITLAPAPAQPPAPAP